jgi:GMP synthase (glutamine-hydrolysing)
MKNVKFLVIEGNKAQAREKYAAASGAEPHQHYAQVLKELCVGAECEAVFPADGEITLPRPLNDYKGVVITGSSLNIEEAEPAALRQVELAKDVFKSGVPFFGSCWGLQVATVAAGGRVSLNPKGRELGVARRILITEEGRKHPLLQGRDVVYDAMAIHEDYVSEIPPGMTVLAGNDMAAVQAAEIRYDGGVFWGVQYHPEFSFTELAGILERIEPKLVDEGFFETEADIEEYAAHLRILDKHPNRYDLAWRYGIEEDVLERDLRRLDISNWITHQVCSFPRS